MNRLQLRRTTQSGVAPTLAQMLEGELAINLTDKDVFFSNGIEVVQLNHLKNMKGDASNRVVTDAQIAAWTGKQDALGYTPLNKAGDTMGGYLTLSGAPSNSNHAATKSYVDTAVSALSGVYRAPVQNLTALAALDSKTNLADKALALVEDEGALYRFDAESVVAANGATVIAPNDGGNGRWIKVQAATQSHEALTNLLGGAPGDHQHLTTNEKNAITSHYTDSSLHLTSAQNVWLDNITVSSAEVNHLVGVTSDIQSQLNGKQTALGFAPLDVAGGTMTGPLVLAADPTSGKGAATRDYVDNIVLTAHEYTDTKASETLTAAQQYTDGKVASVPYDVPFSFAGKPVVGQEVVRMVMARNCLLPVDLQNSIAVSGVAALNGEQFHMLKNGVEFGTLIFAGGSDQGVFTATSGVTFSRGDVLTFITSEIAGNDPDFQDLAITFAFSLV